MRPRWGRSFGATKGPWRARGCCGVDSTQQDRPVHRASGPWPEVQGLRQEGPQRSTEGGRARGQDRGSRPWAPCTETAWPSAPFPQGAELSSPWAGDLREVSDPLPAGWSWARRPPWSRPGLQLEAAATLPTSPRALPSLVRPGLPPPGSAVLERGLPRPRGTRSARTNAGQTARWIFHGGSQTKALGSIFLHK